MGNIVKLENLVGKRYKNLNLLKHDIETITNKKIEVITESDSDRFDDMDFMIDFSETQYRSNGSAFKKTYIFTVEKDGTPKFTSSALTMVIDESWDKDYHVNAYENWVYTKELLIRWQKVKSKLHEEINKQKRLKSEILNFQI